MTNATTNTIALASDHAGLELKASLVNAIKAAGYEALDLGPHSSESVDYPDYANVLCDAIAAGKATRGILICGSGIGMSIAANRHPHIRAGLVHTPELARLTRQHNDANVLVLGARFVDDSTAKAVTTAFLTTAFEGGRHQTRINKLG